MVCKYSGWNRGQEEALLNKLGGQEVAMKLLDCREVTVQFRSDKIAVIEATLSVPVWGTITHRGRRNAESYRAGLSSTGCKICVWANSALGLFVASSVDEEVDLGCASVADLGFKEATQLDVICDRIVTLGYGLCLPEDGPVLREQYLVQPKDEWVRLAMKPIRGSDGDLNVFSVERVGSGLWIGGGSGSPDILFGLDVRFVFRLRKRPLVA